LIAQITSIRSVSAARAAEAVQASSWSFAWPLGLIVCWATRVGDEGRVESERLGLEDQVAVATPGGVLGILGVVARRPGAADDGPDAEAGSALCRHSVDLLGFERCVDRFVG
jgi:hypothetical protein